MNAGPRGAEGDAHPAPARERTPLAALVFGLFGAPVAWALQTLVSLPVAAHGCYPRLVPLASPVIGGLRGLVFTVGAFALAVSIAATAVALRSWARTREEHQGHTGSGSSHTPVASLLETGEGRTRFMALAGVMTSVTFLLACGAHLATVFLVAPCGV